ncbi:MAG TPA: PRC-barrel domain-containing protein [Arenibaculum sp.]|nr:PRC-barrel domain-containing protein [Arenibaculum sp.]
MKSVLLRLAVLAVASSFPACERHAQAQWPGIPFDHPPVRNEDEILSAADRTPGWRLGALLDARVVATAHPEDGRGTVMDMLLGPDGRILAVLITAGGHLGIGEMIFSIPWNRAVFSADLDRLMVDFDEIRLAPFSPFGGVHRIEREEVDRFVRFEARPLEAGPGLWKATELLGRPLPAGRDGEPAVVADFVVAPDGGIVTAVAAPEVAVGKGSFLGLFD